MTFPFGSTVTLLTRTRSGRDSDGNDTFATTPTVLTNVPVWPGGEGSGTTGAEQLQGRDTVTSSLTLLLPRGTSVTTIDAIIYNGVTYEVEGIGGAYLSPFTALDPGVLVRVKRVEG